MEQSILYREADWFNPFFFQEKQIAGIIFYKDGKMVCDTKWFGRGSNPYKAVEFPFEIKNAIKVNFERKVAYLVRNSNHYEKTYVLYIHADLVDLKFSEHKIDTSRWDAVEEHDVYEVKLTGTRYVLTKNEYGEFEKLPKQGEYAEQISCHYKYTDTPEAVKCKELSKQMGEKAGVSIPWYDVHRLMKYFNITKKRKQCVK